MCEILFVQITEKYCSCPFSPQTMLFGVFEASGYIIIDLYQMDA